MTATASKRMSVAEFLVWEGIPDRRCELYDGVPVEMAPAQGFHQFLASTLNRLVGNAAEKRPPCAARSEAGILAPSRADTYYQADIVVTCSPSDMGNTAFVEKPVLVIEILSPSTEDKDRKIKLPDYRGIASVREILFVDSQRRYVEIHRRQDGGRWLVDLLRDPDARVVLDSIGLDTSLESIYANVTFDQPDPAAAANA